MTRQSDPPQHLRVVVGLPWWWLLDLDHEQFAATLAARVAGPAGRLADPEIRLVGRLGDLLLFGVCGMVEDGHPVGTEEESRG